VNECIGIEDVVGMTEKMISLRDFLEKGTQIVKSTTENYAVVAVDMSNFRYLNDMYGTEEGDRVMDMMEEAFFRDNPNCVLVCNIVGDQYRAIVNIGNKTIEEEAAYISEINKKLEKKLEEMYPKVFLHVYTGLCFVDRSQVDDNYDIRTTVDKAHFAKKNMKGTFDTSCAVYEEIKYKKFSKQMEIVKIFEHALVNGGIRPFFQPKIDANTGKLVGMEALCRMFDSDEKMISPGLFIPVLEKNGMLSRLDDCMMETTFSIIKEWLDADILKVPVSINLSRVDFYNPNLVERIDSLRKKYDIPVEYVELEITESAFVEYLSSIVDSVEKLRELGFKISVDDFGSGYSSLGLLVKLPADIIKLDGSFIRESLRIEKGVSVIESIIGMLNKIRFDIICEGVETKEEEELIKRFGCTKIQGFLYDKPLAKKEFEEKYLK